MSAQPPWVAAVLAHQLKMNPQTLALMREHGLVEPARLTLDFAYVSPSEQAARMLCEFLRAGTDYEVGVSSSRRGLLRGREWAVAGSTRPIDVSLDVVNEWVTWMVVTGAQNGENRFDGWGAAI